MATALGSGPLAQVEVRVQRSAGLRTMKAAKRRKGVCEWGGGEGGVGGGRGGGAGL